MKALMRKLGSRGLNLLSWTAEELQGAFFSTYPHQPTPVDPGLLVLSMALSNTPVLGDLYDLYTGVTGYDPITQQYLAGWERLANIAGAIPLLGLSGANIRHGAHAAESLIDSGDELAQFIGKACSFDEDTPVATSEGSIPISEIDVGDQALAWNETLGETGYYTITAVWGHEDPVTVQLVIDGETVDTTPEHPFLTANGDWVAAGELQVGDAARNAAGETGVVEAVEFGATPQVMYNMTVADAHTYTVGDGQWVVHNGCIPALRTFRCKDFYAGDEKFSLTRERLTHVLERHHPQCWDGSVKTRVGKTCRTTGLVEGCFGRARQTLLVRPWLATPITSYRLARSGLNVMGVERPASKHADCE